MACRHVCRGWSWLPADLEDPPWVLQVPFHVLWSKCVEKVRWPWGAIKQGCIFLALLLTEYVVTGWLSFFLDFFQSKGLWLEIVSNLFSLNLLVIRMLFNSNRKKTGMQKRTKTHEGKHQIFHMTSTCVLWRNFLGYKRLVHPYPPSLLPSAYKASLWTIASFLKLP